jgi:hypothetical protein
MPAPIFWTPDRIKKAVDEICLEIANGMSLRAACEPEGRPTPATFLEWMQVDIELAKQYARAREDQADFYADEVVEISDTEEDPNRARVRIDARKWAAGKRKPKVYGDKILNEITGKDGEAIEVRDPTADARRVAFMLARAATKASKVAEDAQNGS